MLARRRRAAGPVPGRRAAASGARCSTSRCSAARPSPARASSRSALSASIFAMFLYLTLYIQDVLGYSPAAGRPALPADHAAVVHRGPDRRSPQRADAGAPAARPRPAARRRRPARDDGDRRRPRDGPSLIPGFLLAGVGIGHDQPAARLDGDRRRARTRAAGWPRASTHLPPGRDRDRHRRPRRGLPARGHRARRPPRWPLSAPGGAQTSAAAHGQLDSALAVRRSQAGLAQPPRRRRAHRPRARLPGRFHRTPSRRSSSSPAAIALIGSVAARSCWCAASDFVASQAPSRGAEGEPRDERRRAG